MDEKIESDWLGASQACEWYAELANEYDWNPRYWEQRALAEARNKNYPRARSFAEHAVSLRQDTLTLNTLGSILTDMALNYFAPASYDAQQSFWVGVESLRNARHLGQGRFEHPYVTFFSRALRFVDRQGESSRDTQILNEWQAWMNDARRAEIFRHAEYEQQLTDFHKRWLEKGVPLIRG
jgi:acyl-CoA thioesterase FadM